MPNWVYNNLTIKAKSEKRLLEVLQEITSEEDGKMVLDFNKIIPAPAYVFQKSADCGVKEALNAYININNITSDEELNKILNDPHWDWDSNSPKFQFIDMNKEQFIEKYKDLNYEPKIQIVSWYDWNTANWGTKWNASTVSINISGKIAYIEFDTAWSVPEPIYEELLEKYPDVIFDWKYWEPMMDWAGHNGSYIEIEDGLNEYIEFLLDNGFISNPEEIGYKKTEDGDYREITDEEYDTLKGVK